MRCCLLKIFCYHVHFDFSLANSSEQWLFLWILVKKLTWTGPFCFSWSSLSVLPIDTVLSEILKCFGSLLKQLSTEVSLILQVLHPDWRNQTKVCMQLGVM